MAQAAAPLSKPVQRKPIKHTASAPPDQMQHRNKRPRVSDFGIEPSLREDSKRSASWSIKADGGKRGALAKGMTLAFIDDALARRARGDETAYRELTAQFQALLPSTDSRSSAASVSTSQAPPETASQRRVWLEALTHVVAQLDKSHAHLVETIVDVPWATLDDTFVAVYVRFITALVSARPEWLKIVLVKCVRGLRYRSCYTTSSPHALPSLTRRTVYSRLHSLLRALLLLVPTLSSTLSPMLTAHFPSKRETRAAQICYIDNLLEISDYCPALVEDVFTLVIERALIIDAEIQGEVEDWEEVEEEMAISQASTPQTVRDVVDRPTAEDGDSDSSDDESDDGSLDLDNLTSDDEPDPISDDEAARMSKETRMSDSAIRKVLEHRAKLDAILKIVLDHIATAHGLPALDGSKTEEHETTPTPEELAAPKLLEQRRILFNTLLDIFDRTFLRTFKTRNTQFLLFYLCSLDVETSDKFIGVLVARALLEIDAPHVTRVAAAGYIASFVSRASFVDSNTTRTVVRHLCRFLEVQMEDYHSGDGGTEHLPVFYAVAQAVFYIFCFRWKDLLDDTEEDEGDVVFEPGRRWILGLETVKKLVTSPFNPLKVCAQPVVTQFSSIAHKTGFLYCFAILDANRRVQARDSFPASSQGPSHQVPVLQSGKGTPRQLLVNEEMDSFFPFDPFKLPLSSAYIDRIYRVWDQDEDGTDTETSTDSESDVDTDEGSGHDGDVTPSLSRGLLVPGFSSDDTEEDLVSRSFEAMSLSPDRSEFGGRSSISSLA